MNIWVIRFHPSNIHPAKANSLHPAALHSAAFAILDKELPPSSLGPGQRFGIAGQKMDLWFLMGIYIFISLNIKNPQT